MLRRDNIVIGASAGGVEVVDRLVHGLPKDLPAAVFVVIHTSPRAPGVLPAVLNRNATIHAAYAIDHEPIRHGRVYVAPPDHHLLIKPGYVRVTRGPRENGFRPAVDPLFRTAAVAHGPKVIGVILSGGLDDGSAGLVHVKEQGGLAIVQDPRDAAYPSMPASALQLVAVDHVLPAAEIPAKLTQLVHESLAGGVSAMARDKQPAPDVAEVGTAALESEQMRGPPSAFTCPECGGCLWELKEGKLVRYRCHVGHSFSVEALMDGQVNGIEEALWTALRALEEHAGFQRRLARRAQQQRWPGIVRDYEQQATLAEQRAALIREVLVREAVKPDGRAAQTARRARTARPGRQTTRRRKK